MKAVLLAVAGLLFGGGPAAAGAQALALSGTGAPMVVGSIPPEASSVSLVGAAGSYSMLSSGIVAQKLTVQLDRAMPAGTRLEINVAAPLGATSTGWTMLGTTPVNVVRNIGVVALSVGYPIQYRFTAAITAGVVPRTTRGVTFTLVAGA